MTDPDLQKKSFDWREIEQEIATKLIWAAFLGVAYLVYIVPRQLDALLLTQKYLIERNQQTEQLVSRVQGQVDGLSTRVARLEGSK
jgi:hypothetical protein